MLIVIGQNDKKLKKKNKIKVQRKDQILMPKSKWC
jgi:hypothetical protein